MRYVLPHPVAAAALLALAACHSSPAPTPSDPASDPADAASVAAGIDSSPVAGAQAPGSEPVPVRPGTDVAREKAARAVLLDWARNLENRRFAQSFAQFSPGTAPGGIDGTGYARAFVPWKSITVAMPSGIMEAEDAGYFYRAPTTITLRDGARTRTLRGTVTLYNEGDGKPWAITAANGLVP